MTPIRVATRLVHPATIYRLTVGGTTWDYGHPLRWAEGSITADMCMDPGSPRTPETERARGDFWECVAASVVWPSGTDQAARIIAGAKIAEHDRAKVAAGHFDLFGDM